MRQYTLPLIFGTAAVLSMCASAFHLPTATGFVPGLGLRSPASAAGAGLSCGLRASVRVRSSRVRMDLKMSEVVETLICVHGLFSARYAVQCSALQHVS